MRRSGICTIVVTGLVAATLTAGTASAATGSATAQVGAASIGFGEGVTRLPAVAPCQSPGGQSATEGASIDGVRFGSGTTSCVQDPATGLATAEVVGKQFRLDLLLRYAGPLIEVGDYAVSCTTTATGSTASVDVSATTGLDVPEEIPVGYTVTVPGANPQDRPMARVVLNEVTAPTPADGSMTVHALHVVLFPDGGPATGDIYAGTVHCSPR